VPTGARSLSSVDPFEFVVTVLMTACFLLPLAADLVLLRDFEITFYAASTLIFGNFDFVA